MLDTLLRRPSLHFTQLRFTPRHYATHFICMVYWLREFITGRSPLLTHYRRTVLQKKKHVILSLFVLRRFSLGYVGLIQFRVSKQTNQAPVNYIITCNLSVNDISFIYIHTV